MGPGDTADQRTAGKARVLVVDDEEYVRLLVGQILSHAGYAVEVAPDGAAALERLEGRIPDLIILDLMMPGIDGWGVLERLRGRSHAPPVVVLTAHGGYEIFTRLVREGVAGYLSKPFKLHDLLAVCAKVLGDREADVAGQERRQEPRRTLMVEVRVLSRGASSVSGELANLSQRGAQVDLAVPLEPAERVEVAFQVRGGGTPLRLLARVEWRQQSGQRFTHGLAFAGLGAEAEARLAELAG